MTWLTRAPKRSLLGRPMRSSQLAETLPGFCSDPLSSVAYATEENLLLSLGGLSFFHLSWYVAAAIAALTPLPDPAVASRRASGP